MNPSARRAFLDDYRTIRHAEGRGSHDSAYYLALPERDLSGRNQAQWDIRARTFRHFARTILREQEERHQWPLSILDLGAGNCWMSNQLSARGHHVYALDIFSDERDGLRARHHYPHSFSAIEAPFDQLPIADASIDLAIFNSSFHYATDYARTLREVRRCLRPQGLAVIMDSPVYQRPEHGEQMRLEKYAQFEQRYGFRSDRIASIDFLDRVTLGRLAQELNIRWQELQPWYGWLWFLRPYRAKLARKRPPSQFCILVAHFEDL